MPGEAKKSSGWKEAMVEKNQLQLHSNDTEKTDFWRQNGKLHLKSGLQVFKLNWLELANHKVHHKQQRSCGQLRVKLQDQMDCSAIYAMDSLTTGLHVLQGLLKLYGLPAEAAEAIITAGWDWTMYKNLLWEEQGKNYIKQNVGDERTML